VTNNPRPYRIEVSPPGRRTMPWLLLALLLMLPGLLEQSAQSQSYKIVYAFNGKDQLSAGGTLFRDKNGNLYGVSPSSVNHCTQGPCGAIYKIDPTGGDHILPF